MKNLNALLKALGLFLVIYISLFSFCSWQPVATFTNEAYRGLTGPILKTLFPEAHLELQPDSPPESDIYTFRAVFISKKEIEAQKALAREKGLSQVDLKAQEYDIYLHLLFTSFLIFLWSLILVTPISWLQKGAAVFTGTILFYGYTVFKVAIFLLDLFNRSSFDMYKLSPMAGNLAEGLSYVLKSLGLSAFVVVFIWVLVVYRKRNAFFQNVTGQFFNK